MMINFKLKDKEGNIFTFRYYENGHPVYATRGGCKHIFESEQKYYEVLERKEIKL